MSKTPFIITNTINREVNIFFIFSVIKILIWKIHMTNRESLYVPSTFKKTTLFLIYVTEKYYDTERVQLANDLFIVLRHIFS